MDSAPAPSLAEQLCFDLYAASRAVTGAYRPPLGKLGITYPQYLVLLVLWERGECTVTQITQALHLDHGTLTPVLRRMEQADLVTRTRDAVDERVVRVGLAEGGERMRAEASRIHCDMKALIGLDEEEFAELQATLRMIAVRVGR